MPNIRVIFIIPETYEDEQECSEITISAFQACKTNDMQVEWVKDCAKLPEGELEKTDFAVFEKFEGEQFLKLKETKATIVGAKCLLTCLVEGRGIPNLSWPIFDLSMLDCVITVSHIPKREKEGLKEKIQMMGGQYTDSFFEKNTHLVTDSVKSEKYINAAELGMKLMLPSWVDAVWEASQTRSVHCDDEEFNKHRCPALHKLLISSTGFTSTEERAELKQLIKENGGTYDGQLYINSTDVLICKSSSNSDKLKAAKKSKKVKCVTYKWLEDSVAKGYALKDTDYVVRKATSTPTKTKTFIDPNFSVMSSISSIDTSTQRSIFQETVNITSATPDSITKSGPRKRKSSSLDDVSDTIDGIDIKAVKKAGSFLDGCCVYIAGFTADQREKMSRILNLGGATRYDQISDRITHIIIGDPTQSDVRVLQKEQSAPIVSLQWLCECIQKQKVVSEDEYLVSLQTKNSMGKSCDSPISQKGLKLLRREISKDIIPPETESKNCNEDAEIAEMDKEIMQQYLKPNTSQEDTLALLLQGNPFNSNQIENLANNEKVSQPENTQTSKKAIVNANTTSESTNISITVTDDDLTEQIVIFQGFKFLIFYFDEQQSLELQEYIEKCGGDFKIITDNLSVKNQLLSMNLSKVDYIVVPVFMNNTREKEIQMIIEMLMKKATNQNKNKKIEVITDYFIMDCCQNLELVPVEYYHRPLLIDDNCEDGGPLKECVVTISSYSGTERVFLNNLVVKLGGIFQEQLCRVKKLGILATTHLLNPEPSGKKYEAAIRWGLPIVTKDWLLECAKTGNLEFEEKYLVGDAKAPTRENVIKPVTVVKSPVQPPVDQNISTLDFLNPPESEAIADLANISNLSLKENRDDNINVGESEDKTKSSLNTSVTKLELIDEINLNPESNFANISNSSSKENRDSNVQEEELNRTECKVLDDNPATPTSSKYFPTGKLAYTPLNRIIRSNPDSPQFSSQVTPVNEIMNRFRMSNLSTTQTSTPELPKRYKDVDTPETPYGAFIQPNPSPHLRKEFLKWINGIPEHKPRRNSTPFSELKRKMWNKITHTDEDGDKIQQPDFSDDPNVSLNSNKNRELHNDTPDTPQNAIISSKLHQLQQMMSSSGGNRTSFKRRESMVPAETDKDAASELKNSQACTVGWDYVGCGGTPEQQESPMEQRRMVFMITSIENNEKENLIKQIEELGSSVSDLQQFDQSGTHLLAPKPQRTEKMLSCLAAGKWILHPSYIEKSTAAGRFLEEDAFEYGNPRANKDIMAQFNKDKKLSPEALHFWRVEVNKRGYGAFHDMRAIIVSPKRDPIVRIIEAGGGMVVDAKPPFDEDVYATHCLIDLKLAPDLSVYVPLAKQGIYCVNTTYIYDFLYRNVQDVRDAIFPDLAKYYKE